MDVIRLTMEEIGTRANYTANGGRMARVCCSRFAQQRSGCHDVNADLEHRRRWCGIEVLGGGRDQRGFVSLGPSQGRLRGGDGREHDGAAHFALASMTVLLLKSERPLCKLTVLLLLSFLARDQALLLVALRPHALDASDASPSPSLSFQLSSVRRRATAAPPASCADVNATTAS